MKKAFACATFAAALAMGGAACAADLGSLKDSPLYAPSFSWAGAYAGVHAGGVWSDVGVTNYDEFYPAVDRFTNSTSGVFGGAQFGYNVQRGNIVYGVELDFGGMDLGHSASSAAAPYIVGGIDSGFYGDVTGRLGLSLGRALVYAKGGFAFYDGNLSITDFSEPKAVDGALTGWTLGGGVEYMLTPAWSVKAEYQYFDFGTDRLIMSDGDRYDNSVTLQTVKVGINYHVGAAAEPLK